MFEYLQFPKLLRQIELQATPEIEAKCLVLIHKYETAPLNHPFNVQYDNNLDQLETTVLESLTTKLDLASTLAMIPKFYMSMELDRLSNLLNRILQSHNYIEIMCHLYISHMYQIWFCDKITLNKYMNSIHKRIHLSKVKPSLDLLAIVDIITYFNNFKNFGEYKNSLPGDVFIKYGFGEEYCNISTIDQLLNKPFNQINSPVPRNLSALVNDCRRFQINFNDYKAISFNDIDYLIPTADNMTFEEYFLLVIKFKYFLNIIRITSKITNNQLKTLIGDDDTTKYILLISSLDLNKIGIGYSVNGDYFYNNGEEKIPINDIVKINEMLELERLSLIVKNALINRLK